MYLTAVVVPMLALSLAAEPTAMRHAGTVPQLARIDGETRAWLATNPEGLSPVELNARAEAIHVVEVDNGLSGGVPGDTLRLVAWNMERGRHWEKAVELVKEHPGLRDADVFFLSEMDLGMARSGNAHTTRRFAAALGMNFAYAVEFLELSKGKAEEHGPGENTWGYHGNAIVSRFPLQHVRMVRFPGIEKWYGSGEHRLGGRNAVIAEIEVDGRRVTLVSTHLESGLQDNAVRAAEGRMIREELQAHASGQAVLLGGDLNAFHKSQVIVDFRADGFEVDAVNVLDQGTSQYLRDGEIRTGGAHIDYIVTKGAEVVGGPWSPAVIPAIWPEGESLGDHAIVTAAIRVQRDEIRP